MTKFNNKLPVLGMAVIIIGLLSYGGYLYWNLYGENTLLREKVAEFEKDAIELKSSLASTTTELKNIKQENSNLSESLNSEQNKNKVFESQIKDISGTVDTLKKLSETDQELLKKYSKVYFLNENYAPAQLSSINSEYLFSKNKPQLIHSGVLPYITAMFAAADRDGVKPQIISAYRSFYEQISVKSGHEITYGAGTANQFSADQGYSEHQLGTAIDLTDSESQGVFSAFEKSPGYKWLTENAYKFGFILSYPKSNSYYIFEPWHWRFVGVSLATTLHNKGEYFYNLTQNEIDEYLISIFN